MLQPISQVKKASNNLFTRFNGIYAAYPTFYIFPKYAKRGTYNPGMNYLYYQNSFRASVVQALKSVTTEMESLKKAATPLLSASLNSVYQFRTVISSRNDIIKATAFWGAKEKNYDLMVTQLAKAQKNKSCSLNSNTITSVKTVVNFFQIKFKDKVYNFSVNVNTDDINKTVFSKVAATINKSNIGIAAKIVEEVSKGTSWLEITNSKTGTGNDFLSA